jgi:hypothetical protein
LSDYSIDLQTQRKKEKRRWQPTSPGRILRWFHGRLHDCGQAGSPSANVRHESYFPQPVKGAKDLPHSGKSAATYEELMPFLSRTRRFRPTASISRPKVKEPVRDASRGILDAVLDEDGDVRCPNCGCWNLKRNGTINLGDHKCMNCGKMFIVKSRETKRSKINRYENVICPYCKRENHEVSPGKVCCWRCDEIFIAED